MIHRNHYPKSRFRKGKPFLGLSLRVPLKAGKGAYLHAEVTFRHAGVAISLEKAGLLRFARKDRILNRDLGLQFMLTTSSPSHIMPLEKAFLD